MIDLSRLGQELQNLEPRAIAYAASALLSILLLLLFWRWYRRRRARAWPCYAPLPAVRLNFIATCWCPMGRAVPAY